MTNERNFTKHSSHIHKKNEKDVQISAITNNRTSDLMVKHDSPTDDTTSWLHDSLPEKNLQYAVSHDLNMTNAA
jgi:hypothetical protein